jgi:hypothetical protein
MLFNVDRELVTEVPHAKDYKDWCSRLSAAELDEIRKALNARIGQCDIHTSSWMPGSNWQGTAYQPIYDKACNQSFQQSGWFFGLILWDVMVDRPEEWYFIKDPNGDILGTTYFRPRNGN